MAFRLKIRTGSPTPIYRQIVDQIGLALATGAACPGDDIPSVRALAEQLVINPNTVAKAYSELRREGIIDSRPGRGMTLCDRRTVLTKSERVRRIKPAIENLARQAVVLGFEPDQISSMLLDEMNRPALRRPASGGQP